jgi:hypothetical protein
MPVYHVKTPTSEHIVEATNQSVALNHVVRNTITVKNMTATDLAAAIKAGKEIESAGAETTPKPADPKLPNTTRTTNTVRINGGPALDADSDEGRKALAGARRDLQKAADKGESIGVQINDGPELTLGSAEADEAIANLKE